MIQSESFYFRLQRNWSNECLKFKGASDRCGDGRKTDEKHIKDT